MGTVTSADGTTICYDAWGEGRPLIIVDGATGHRAVSTINAELGRLLGDEFRVYGYDRRGRGDSGDTAPYEVRREIEDLAALIETARIEADRAGAAGEPAILCGFSSGALLCLDAVAAGLPVSRLALFEPPFVVGDGRPPLPGDYVERLDAAVAAGRPGDAVELFLTAAAGVPAEFLGGMRQSPIWAGLEAVAPTIAYDGRIMGSTMSGAPLPTDRWAAVDVPTLVLYGDGTEPWLRAGAHAAVDLLPTATLRAVEGSQHSVTPEVLAPVLRDFALAQTATR